MAHEVESMAYTNAVPWHGLGTYIAEAPSIQELVIAAKLDWTVSKRELLTPDRQALVRVPGKYALVRDRDAAVLDVVGSVYEPVQNEAAMDFFRRFVDAGAATMETAGSLKGGRYVWALAKLNQDFTLPGDDKVLGYVLLASPHQQGRSLVVRPTSVRVVCNNTLSWALSGKSLEFRHAHRGRFDVAKAQDALGVAREQIQAFEREARALKSLKVIEADVVRILGSLFQPGTEASELIELFDQIAGPRMKRLMDVHVNAPGAEPGTGWGVLNTVTYYADHLASRSADNRMASAWMGTMARFKAQAQEQLAALAAAA